MGSFKITPEEREALQQLVNGAHPHSLQGLMRVHLLERGWCCMGLRGYEFSETGKTVARQLGIKPSLKLTEEE